MYLMSDVFVHGSRVGRQYYRPASHGFDVGVTVTFCHRWTEVHLCLVQETLMCLVVQFGMELDVREFSDTLVHARVRRSDKMQNGPLRVSPPEINHFIGPLRRARAIEVKEREWLFGHRREEEIPTRESQDTVASTDMSLYMTQCRKHVHRLQALVPHLVEARICPSDVILRQVLGIGDEYFLRLGPHEYAERANVLKKEDQVVGLRLPLELPRPGH